MRRHTLYRLYIKRWIDVLLGILALCACAPLMLIIATLLQVIDGHMWFKQQRVGYRNQHFWVYKFRSLSDDGTPTALGKCLRATSLDELPQLLNIIKGDMSWVGPRPLIAAELTYAPQAVRDARASVRPGLTGLAQIQGRKSLSEEEKFAIDITYLTRLSFRCDVYIILQTLWQCIRFKDADWG